MVTATGMLKKCLAKILRLGLLGCPGPGAGLHDPLDSSQLRNSPWEMHSQLLSQCFKAEHVLAIFYWVILKEKTRPWNWISFVTSLSWSHLAKSRSLLQNIWMPIKVLTMLWGSAARLFWLEENPKIPVNSNLKAHEKRRNFFQVGFHLKVVGTNKFHIPVSLFIHLPAYLCSWFSSRTSEFLLDCIILWGGSYTSQDQKINISPTIWLLQARFGQ